MPVAYHHVDVFADGPYSGNSLAVFVDPPPLSAAQMSLITQELRHFETIFVRRSGDAIQARVFDLIEELDFAGHPVLGAAAVLHDLDAPTAERYRAWTITLPAGTVSVSTRRSAPGRVAALLETERPELVARPPAGDQDAIAAAFGLTPDDLDEALPPEVWSTGLRYLIVPVRGEALARARVAHRDLTGFLEARGAQFAYLLDAATPEGRHWNNDGLMEDVGTGSAAGCVAAYLMHRGRLGDGERMTLAQGRFTGRPSAISIGAYGGADTVERVTVGGEVVRVGLGTLEVLPGGER
ncbi:PhzF family phenazine biosynthesis protein [Nonomuraea helvata]|uniref:PhzF family phenazine biosynthesis protein n=1 Tax=Nonomuraea helvata TaxID=37484 RepID=A0ABV5SD34_9ACTN